MRAAPRRSHLHPDFHAGTEPVDDRHQPVLKPGESFEYTSGCPLGTSSGAMEGSYEMLTTDGAVFDAAFPAFSLHLPTAPRTLN